MVRAGLEVLIDNQEDFAVVGKSTTGEELALLADELRPDIVLLELARDDLSPLIRLGRAAVSASVVVLSGSPSGELAAGALRAGARGYLFKETAAEELLATLRAVSQGLTVLHPAAAQAALGGRERAPTLAAGAPGETLTARELEVLTLLAQGLPNKTIASRLHLSEHTVKFHVASIIGKLGVASRTEAVTVAARQGLIAL
jgi:DNA-binding NarL/FixJ family response regulator